MATILATYSGGGTLWNPGVEVQDGDAVIWFYREASSEVGPTARMAQLADSGGTAIDFTYYNKGDWGAYSTYDYYIVQWQGTFTYDSEGTPIVNDKIYLVFDQFTSFTNGNHYIKFNLPGVSRAQVEAAHLVRGVTAATPGTYHYYSAESPTWDVFYEEGGSKTGDNFPVSVPLGAGSTLIYCLWSTNFAGGPPSGYNTVPGTLIASYQYYDPTNTPAITDNLISYFDDCTGASKSVSAPDENGASGGFPGTGYYMDAVVINGGAVDETGPTVYFADLLVFNAKTGAVVEF